jgi:lipoate-protein ligase A
MSGAKIMGSAQRRRNGAILQHGSLLFGRSASAPELPGIVDLQPGLDPARLIALWSKHLGSSLKLNLFDYGLTESQLTSVRFLVKDKFGDDRWTRRR